MSRAQGGAHLRGLEQAHAGGGGGQDHVAPIPELDSAVDLQQAATALVVGKALDAGLHMGCKGQTVLAARFVVVALAQLDEEYWVDLETTRGGYQRPKMGMLLP